MAQELGRRSTAVDGAVTAPVSGLERIERFCRLGAARAEVDALTVTYADATGGLELLVATDELAERVAHLEFAIGEGPSFDAVSSGYGAEMEDLGGPIAAHRWPIYAAEAVRLGVRAVWAIPMRSSRMLGTVGLYRRRPGRLTWEQHRQARAIAELISLALVDPGSNDSIGLGLRMDVHRAAGMVMIQADLSIQDALVLLRSVAFTEDARVTDLAADVIAGRRRFERMDDDGLG